MKQHQVKTFKTLFTKRLMLKRILAIIILLGVMATLYTKHETSNTSQVEKDFLGKVVQVIDGDTIKLLTEDKQLQRVRLAFIDAPEIGQAYGQKARKNLIQRIGGQKVRIKVKDTDHYGRIVAQICFAQQDINLSQIQSGYAWHYQYYAKKLQSPKDFLIYMEAERAAREARLGLWREKNPIPPWKFRRTLKAKVSR